MRKSTHLRHLSVVAFTTSALFTASAALAGEGGASFYLLGSGGPGAADLPPLTGIFFDNTAYYYPGKAGGDREFVVGGNVVAGLDAKLFADFATVLWVPSTNALGGTLGIGFAVPVGHPKVGVDVVLTGPNGGTIDISRRDAAWIVGDPVATTELSWKVDPKTHVAVIGTVNIPVGTYREGELSNLAFHRWIVDTSAAITWSDGKWDVSGKAGLTFNGKNHFTDYNSGTDLHLEASVERKLSKEFSLGIQSYMLEQITGDSGAGARLGSFKGRVTGVGPTAAYNFSLGKLPVSARVRYFEEFGAKNRLDGRAFFFSLDFPLHVNLPAAPPAAAPAA